jgi:transposase
MKPIKPSTVKNALQLLEQHKSIRQIAAEVGISKSSVHNISRTLAPTRSKSKGGRPRKFDYRNAFYIRLLIHRGTISTATQATRQYNDENDDPVSANTVRRALRDIGMKAKRAVKKPRLTKSQKKARLNFAIQYKDWTEADWKRVIWSDESKINRISSDGMRYMWVQSNNEPKVKAGNIDPKLVMPTVKHGGGSIMVWGCMTWDGPGFLTRIDSTLDSELYIRILQDELLDTVDWYNIDPEQFIFQQDNDPKHTAKAVKSYLATIGLTEATGRLLTWPSNSPDLNPIEHLWEHLKKKLRERGSIPEGMLDLWKRVNDIWEEETPMEVCRNLIRSMPERMQAVIKAKGGNTRF